MANRLVALVMLVLALAVPPASSQEPGTTSTSAVDVPAPDIIPRPNVGEEPHDAGDRGGALQIVVFLLLVVGVGVVVAMVVRQSRRARADR